MKELLKKAYKQGYLDRQHGIDYDFEQHEWNMSCIGCKYHNTNIFPCSTCIRYKFKKDCFTKEAK